MTVEAKESSEAERARNNLAKNIKLPFYDDDKLYQKKAEKKPWQAVTVVESYVRTSRLKVTGAYNKLSAFNENVSMKWGTAKAHTQGVVSFIQDEPELWQRCGIVAVAAFAGLISGYKRSGLVKARNMFVGGGVATAICWPKQAVMVTSKAYTTVSDPVKDMWELYAPGSPHIPVDTTKITPSTYYSNKPEVEEDHGQSNSEDKDMYSTRGS